ncbi:glucose-6-phosphate isomerase, partial [Thermodesulfobacteriota bacterium]
MTRAELIELPIWKKLQEHSVAMNRPENHLRRLMQDRERLPRFSLDACEISFDFSRQRVTELTMRLLVELAQTRGLKSRFRAMVSGEKVNVTEARAALHTAARDFSGSSLLVDGVEVIAELRAVLEEIKAFSQRVRSGNIVGSTGKPFRHIVVIGIGGSYLGTEFVSEALAAYAQREMQIHYLSNVDIHNFGRIVSRSDPESTLWVVISKSFTTAETMANAHQARVFMERAGSSASFPRANAWPWAMRLAQSS